MCLAQSRTVEELISSNLCAHLASALWTGQNHFSMAYRILALNTTLGASYGNCVKLMYLL